MTYKLLLVGSSDNESWGAILQEAINPLGTLDVAPESEALPRAETMAYHLIIIDAVIVADVPGLVAPLHRLAPNSAIVVVTSSPTWQRARQAFLAGAIDYIQKSVDAGKLRSIFQDILERTSPDETGERNDKANDSARR